MNLIDNKDYLEDVVSIASLPIDWNIFKDSSLMLSGSSGMVGSFLIDVLMHKNKEGLNLKIYALGRNKEKAKDRFSMYWNDPLFTFVNGDINDSINLNEYVDYIIHGASNTHPRQYSTDPVGTITTNIIGTNNLLKYAKDHKTKRFVFLSSVEIYGENKGDTDQFKEDYLGYIDSNTARAGYPESKRCGESLCQSYISQYGLDIVIPRLSRIYGPSMLQSDTKAISQFIKKGVMKEDIVLKSEGTQVYSYSYVADSVAGILTILAKGKCGEAYNVSDPDSDIALKDLAKIIADNAGTSVIFELPDAIEKAGYSTATKATLDSSKIRNELDFKTAYDIKLGVNRTIDILRTLI